MLTSVTIPTPSSKRTSINTLMPSTSEGLGFSTLSSLGFTTRILLHYSGLELIMFALRRSASSLRNQNYHVGIARICFSRFSSSGIEVGNDAIQQGDSYVTSGNSVLLSDTPSRGFCFSPKSISSYRSLSSHAGAKSSNSGTDVEDGFSELEEPLKTDGGEESEEDSKGLLSENENGLEDDSVPADEDELGLSGVEVDSEKAIPKDISGGHLFNIVMKAPRKEVGSALGDYVEEGHTLDRNEVSMAMLGLRRRQMFDKALQMSEWVESKKYFDFGERDYASRLDLIAKVHGLHKAEKYIENIPEPFRSEVVYRTLLANCVSASNIKKSEEVFNKIRDLGFPLTEFSCNQLLVLYKRLDRKKIADVLVMMEKENVKPSAFTYRILIDIKGRTNDIEGMEQIVETMKAEGVNPDKETLATVARHYILGGHTEKGEAILKDIEGDHIEENRWAAKLLLPLYAALGKEGDVERIWKVCEETIRADESLAAIEAWGKLGKIEKAEEVFEHVAKTWKKISPRYYNFLLKVYADHKLLAKGKDLVKRMSNNGCNIGPFTLDALVKLYLGAGEVEKADSVLHKAIHQRLTKPMYCTYTALLYKYGKRGDIHNAEKIFHELRKTGYTGRMRMYQLLLDAYINAKTPAYGFKERMKADNIFPNNIVFAQLKTVDAFKKSLIGDLLD